MFVIMNVGTERLYENNTHYGAAKYETERGAKGSCTRLNKASGNTNQWIVMSFDQYKFYYQKPVKMVERTNIMTGKKYMEAENTPVYMSPACESYWSM